MSEIQWGPEIRVDGKRPEWLADDQVLMYHDGYNWYGDSPNYRWTAYKVGHQKKVRPGDFDDWPNATVIRLPADHPHYHQKPTPERDPALWDRMEALVRAAAVNGIAFSAIATEARAIVAALPKPVDADLVEARRIVGDAFDGGTKSLNGDAVRAGARDNAHDVQLVLTAIKRGRALAAQDAARG